MTSLFIRGAQAREGGIATITSDPKLCNLVSYAIFRAAYEKKKRFQSCFLFTLGSQLSSNRRRRSGSRTSHGSHGKTLRLSFEQKLGISNKEVERHEANLSHFRSVNFLKIFINKDIIINYIFFFTILEIKSRIPVNMGPPRLRNEL